MRFSRALMALLLLVAAANAAPIFTNGSLTGPIANGDVPSGWTVLLETPDTMDENSNVGIPGQTAFVAAPISASPDGGTWVGLGIDTEGGFLERFGQTVTGFTPGQMYSINWYMGNFGYSEFGYNDPNSIEVLIDGVSVGTGSVLSPMRTWVSQSLSFTATSTSHLIAFQPGTAGKSYVSIDGISFGGGVPGDTVPEPAVGWAVGGVAAAIIAVRRRRAA